MDPEFQKDTLVVCSATLSPVRKRIHRKLLNWIDQYTMIPRHTFVVDESKIPLNPESPDGYWYCAGDFCDVNAAGVYQSLVTADLTQVVCLVAPNIKMKTRIGKKK